MEKKLGNLVLVIIHATRPDSEDSQTLNTSFVERHNLIIRQGSAYLRRKTPNHARDLRTLREHLELFQCYYNFIRPHSALKFGSEVRTPAKQAGLVRRNLSFRDIFSINILSFLLCLFVLYLSSNVICPIWRIAEEGTHSQQHLMEEEP